MGTAVDFDGDYAYTAATKPENEYGYNKLFHNGCMKSLIRAGCVFGKPTAGPKIHP